MQTINFELNKPIKYANGSGQEIECSHIELKEPTGKISHLVCSIEGIIQSALIKSVDLLDSDTVEKAKEEASKKKEDEEVLKDVKDGEGMLAIITASQADMNKIVLHFKEIFKSVAWMGGEKLITSARLDEMSHKDLRLMIGVYIANFIMN